MTRTVLIVDDEANMRWVLSRALEDAGYTAHGAANADEALSLLAREPVDLVLLDLKLRGENGLTILRRLREQRPDLVVMMLTAYGTVPNAVEAMQLGAADFLRKPFDVEDVLFKVGRALERRTMQQQIARLTAAQQHAPAFKALIGVAVAWQTVTRQAQALAATDEDVLLVGEPGSGRATLARAVHAASERHAAPLVERDLHAYQHPLAMLFGEDSGAGAWEAAGSGAVLLQGVDGSGEAHAELAVRLARAARYRPRVFIVATNEQDLTDVLRAALPVRLHVPPLRERPEDIALFAQVFTAAHAITPSAMRRLEQYAWPGNVAELRGVMARAVQLAGDDPIDVRHIPEWVTRAAENALPGAIRLPVEGLNLDEVEQALIRQALAQTHGNKSKAAELLGLTRHTLLYRMEKYGISVLERDET